MVCREVGSASRQQAPEGIPVATKRTPLLSKLTPGEGTFLADALRQETVGGALLLIAAVAGLIAANTDLAAWYASVQALVIGPSAVHLDLSLESWAADGLLAIFFYVAGLELKRELVVGTLRNRQQAILPIVAAVAGMVLPAMIFLVMTAGNAAAREGWAVPMATDIAFALAVLAVVGSNLPPALRAFLLTLAVVDDLGAITVIALFFSDNIEFLPLVIAGALLVVYVVLQHARVRTSLIYVPLALTVWVMFHESGVHATVAGILLGLLTRVKPDEGEERSPSERLEHRIRPMSAAFAVPVFAFLSAGVALSPDTLSTLADDAAALAVVVGLVVGKFVGVFGASWLTAKLTRAELGEGVTWPDMAGLALLSGIGFTVSLLITELAFTSQPQRLENVKTAVLVASVVAAALAIVLLRIRDRGHRRMTLTPEV